jgi:hypothetical protein
MTIADVYERARRTLRAFELEHALLMTPTRSELSRWLINPAEAMALQSDVIFGIRVVPADQIPAGQLVLSLYLETASRE